MSLEIIPFVLGPLQNNSYLAADPASGEAVIIDPSFDSEVMLAELEQRRWRLSAVWLTHGHFDHCAGASAVIGAFDPPPPLGLHPADLALYNDGGGSRMFGIAIPAGPKPQILFAHGQKLALGGETIEVRCTPGHTPGHVIFVAPSADTVFCGDLIFWRGVGRADLPGGDEFALLESIHSQVLTLPPRTRLLSGHGPETTVGEEAEENPFLVGRGL